MRSALRRAAIVLGSMVLALGTAAGARAQAQCGPLAEVHKALVENHGESVIFSGVTTPQGAEIRLYQNRGSGSWSVVGILPDRSAACLLLSGDRAKDGAQPNPAAF